MGIGLNPGIRDHVEKVIIEKNFREMLILGEFVRLKVMTPYLFKGEEHSQAEKPVREVQSFMSTLQNFPVR